LDDIVASMLCDQARIECGGSGVSRPTFLSHNLFITVR